MAFGSMQTQQGLLCVISDSAPESVVARGSGGVDDVAKCRGSHLPEDPSLISSLDAQGGERLLPAAPWILETRFQSGRHKREST